MVAIQDEDTEPGTIAQVQAAVCENISLYEQKYDEDFQEYNREFVQAVWTLLIQTGKQPHNDVVRVLCATLLAAVTHPAWLTIWLAAHYKFTYSGTMP